MQCSSTVQIPAYWSAILYLQTRHSWQGFQALEEGCLMQHIEVSMLPHH